MRKPLAFGPSYERIEEKKDAYLHPLALRKLARESGRYWLFHSQPTTVALPGNRYAKSLASFTSHENEEAFRELLREFAEHGVQRPSGYADVFHERYKSPRVNWSVNARLAPAFAGGWQQSLKPGVHFGTHYKYDLNSAYLWAATLGMPNPASYKRSLRPWGKHKRPGLYRLKLLHTMPGAPFPYHQTCEVLATDEEIEMYSLPIAEIIDGITWDSWIDADKIVESVRLVSTWKQAGRAYWGRWAQMVPLECVAKSKRWKLGNPFLNIPWAHMIVARVRMKLWEFANNAVHVFVDSVITKDELPLSSDIGGWKLERTYNRGVIIRAPGQYGAVEDERLERMSGTSSDSPSRIIPIEQII